MQAGVVIALNFAVAASQCCYRDRLSGLVGWYIFLVEWAVLQGSFAFILVKRLMPGCQHLFDPRRWRIAVGFHALSRLRHAERVPFLERPHLVSKAPLHGVVYRDQIICDLRDAVGTIGKLESEIVPCKPGDPVIALDHSPQPFAQIAFHVERVQAWISRRLMFHRVGVEHPKLFLTVLSTHFLVEAKASLVAEPFLLDHLHNYCAALAPVRGWLVRQQRSQVMFNVSYHVDPNEIEQPEDRRFRVAKRWSGNGIYFFDAVAVFQTIPGPEAHCRDANAIADEVRGVFTNHHTLTQCALTEIPHERGQARVGVRRRDDFDQMQIRWWIKEMGSDETPAEIF